MALLLARVLGGLFSSFGGVFFLYEFLADLQKGSNLLFLLLFVILIAAAVFLLITGAKAVEKIVSGAEVVKDLPKISMEDTKNVEKLIDRNNAISSEWNKTEQERSKIQTLQMQASAEKES